MVSPRSPRSRRMKPVSLRLAGVHAGRRLVEQQQAWLAGQGTRDLQAPLVAIGQVLGPGVTLAAQPDEGAATRCRARHRAAAPRARWPESRMIAPNQAGLEVRCTPTRMFSSAVMLLEEPDVLVGTRDAACSDAGRAVVPSDGVPIEHDLALFGLVEAGDAVEEGGLAGAVGADDADDRALVKAKSRSLTATRPPKRLVTLVDLQKRHAQASVASGWLQAPPDVRLLRRSASSRRPMARGPEPLRPEAHHEHEHRRHRTG